MITRQQLDRFEIRDELGRGAIGDVLLAWDPAHGREIALKVVRISRTDPEMLEAERGGVALQAQLAEAAPQVAAVHEQGVDGDYFWVAMEYVEGEDLSQRLLRGPLLEPQAIDFSLQLLAMLEVCHGFSAEVAGRAVHGIVHGDIKPENLRIQQVDGEERVRLLDFGIAKHLSQTRRFTINLFGSLPYTPPERLDRGVVDRHSDLWAVGIVLYIMVSGKRPFAGDTPEEVERRIRRGEPPQPLPATCSPGLRRIVARSLSFEVERRYATAAELRADLEALREGRVEETEEGQDGPGGPVADLEATRRTVPPANGDFDVTRRTAPVDVRLSEATRRTDRNGLSELTRRTSGEPTAPLPAGEVPAGPTPLAAAAQPGAPPPGPVSGPAGAEPRSGLRLTLLAFFALLIVLGVGSQAWVRGEAREIRRQLLADGEPDLAGLVERYRRAARIALPGSEALSAVEEELHEALVQAAGRILDSYHGDDPSTTERGWREATELLRAAAEMDWRDKASRARLLYARAHLDRIASQALRARGERDAAAEQSRAALAKFEQAAERDSSWPDPYLGVARIYAYDLFDLDRLQEALEKLASRGYPLGRREKAMLADGFRMRGRQRQAAAARAQGTDEEGELVEQAKADFEQAIQLYDKIPSYANVASNRADVEQRLDEMMTRRWEIYFE